MNRTHLPLLVAGIFATILLSLLALFILRAYPVPPSQEELAADVAKGQQYERGAGVTLDYLQALAWYRKAADAGYAPAQVAMGKMTAAGRGVVRDDKAASAWFRRAAENGDPEGQYMLGRDYMRGIATADGKPDNIEAMKWFQLGVGELPDDEIRAAALATQAQLAGEMSDDERMQSARRANDWRDKKAEEK